MSDNARKFKTIPYTMTLKSDAINEYMSKQLSSLIGGLGRIAQLLVITKNDKIINDELKKLVATVTEKTTSSLELFDTHLNALTEGMELFSNEINGPAKEYKIEIGHPIIWGGVSVVKAVEERALNVELLWLNGVIEDEEKERAEKELNTQIRKYVTSIYSITNITNREGGKYDAKKFLVELRASKSNEETKVA